MKTNKVNLQKHMCLFVLNFNSVDTNWKQIQRIINNVKNYELSFTYQTDTSEHNYMAIDDISIINGPCLNKLDPFSRRKRRQTSRSMLL